MGFVEVAENQGVATLTLRRGKVNALNDEVVDQLRDSLAKAESDPAVRAVILTGSANFFSFGFDVPEFLSFTRERFASYLTNFTDLYAYMFLYPKPLVAAINGHAVAGGCMLALACDYRVMVGGKAKISLNEIAFGSSVFPGATEMLRFWTGSANATRVLYSGAMYAVEEAKAMGLVDEGVFGGELMERALGTALDLASKPPRAFAAIKSLLRKTIVDEFKRREPEAIMEFVDIWYSKDTWANLQNIKIV